MRVTGGNLLGRRVKTTGNATTRSTTDRVREALFTRLAHLGRLTDATVLDLYCGTAVLSLEAISRGAQRATCVDNDHTAVAVASDNIAALTPGMAHVIKADVATWLTKNPGAPADVVFLDPPYDVPAAQLESQLAQLLTGGWLSDDAVVVLEQSSHSEVPQWPTAFEDVTERDYGQTVLWFGYTPTSTAENPEITESAEAD